MYILYKVVVFCALFFQAKEKEIADLKIQLTTSVTPGRAELESQLHQVTDTVIQKQTALETLNSERSTLNVQLKRLKVCACMCASWNTHIDTIR